MRGVVIMKSNIMLFEISTFKNKKCETNLNKINKKVSHFQKMCYNKNVKQNVLKTVKKIHICKGGKYGRKN